MYYAHVDLGGGTYAYKKRFLKLVENAHAYYMPDLGGMNGFRYREVNADHWVYIRVTDLMVFQRILDVLGRRYKFYPVVYPQNPDAKIFMTEKTYAQLDYEKRDYVGREVYPGEYLSKH